MKKYYSFLFQREKIRTIVEITNEIIRTIIERRKLVTEF